MTGILAWARGLFGKRQSTPAASLTTPPQAEAPKSFAEGNNAFAFALYAELRQQSGNLFFSPFSIRMALAMTYAGAQGETATQMSSVLRFSAADEKLHGSLAGIADRLNAAAGGKYTMAVANSLWVQDGKAFESEFRALISRHYGDIIRQVDFSRDAEAARIAINKWVDSKTRKRIQELIPVGGVDATTRLVLANAIYFKGKWVQQFTESSTRKEPFYLEGGKSVRAPLMKQQAEVRYLQSDGYQAVDLDYEGGGLSMLVVLPDKEKGLRNLEKGLSASMLRDCVSKLTVREVFLIVPKFTMTLGAELGVRLRALGMSLPFIPREADFSGIDGREPSRADSLFISAVFHKAFVEVNEEGTEAAAATAALMTGSVSIRRPDPIPVFQADHPFLFAIRDKKSGAILFLGRVDDPTRG